MKVGRVYIYTYTRPTFIDGAFLHPDKGGVHAVLGITSITPSARGAYRLENALASGVCVCVCMYVCVSASLSRRLHI